MKSAALACLIAIVARGGEAQAFPHVVQPGETLASLAGHVYGDSRKESLIAGANALDACGGSAVVPGMRLEIPAPLHHRVTEGETWDNLALTWLGSSARADVLARANRAVAWVPPLVGQEIEIPAVVAHVVSDGDSSTTLAARYWGDKNRGWEINAYNGRPEAPMHRGEVILVPIFDLELTKAGLAEARAAVVLTSSQSEVEGLAAQRRVQDELPELSAAVAGGRYLQAVARGNRLLGLGQLTPRQLAAIHRALLEAYVALDARAEAAQSCAMALANDPNIRLDARTTSPKVRAACGK